MYGDPQLWHALLGRLADITISFLKIQVAAGASAVQLLIHGSARSVRTITGAPSCRTPAGSSPRSGEGEREVGGVPRIHFGVGTGELLGLMGEAGADVVGVDWRIRLTRLSGGWSRGRRCKATLTQPSCLRPGKSSKSGPRTWSHAGAPQKGTCSISGMASCRKPTPPYWPSSRIWSTPSRSIGPAEPAQARRLFSGGWSWWPVGFAPGPRLAFWRGGPGGGPAADHPPSPSVDYKDGKGRDNDERRQRAQEGQSPGHRDAERAPAGAEAAGQAGGVLG